MDARRAEEGESWSRRSVLPCLGKGLLQLLPCGDKVLSGHPLQGTNPGHRRTGSLGDHGHLVETHESGTALDLGDSSWYFLGFQCRANPREPPLCLLASSLCLAPLTTAGPCRVNVSPVLQLKMSLLPRHRGADSIPSTGTEHRLCLAAQD